MKNKTNLEKLKKVDPREIWNSETDFTNWLAQEENLLLLSEEIGIEIKLIQTEANIGEFSVDILAEEPNRNRKIIIENQLGVTNHDHLGKIITYASGHNAEVIIWIVKDVRDEHKQAIDWLNEHTDENISFFLINIEIWQIGNSALAPKFEIVSDPNDWAKAIKKATESGELSQLALKELEFLNRFIGYCKEKQTLLRLSKPQPSTPAYYTISLGIASIWIAVKQNVNKRILKVDVYFGNKNVFQKIKEKYQDVIESEIGEKLIWDDMPEYKGATVGIATDYDIDKEDMWNQYFNWLKNTAEKFQKVFPKYIKEIREQQ